MRISKANGKVLYDKVDEPQLSNNRGSFIPSATQLRSHRALLSVRVELIHQLNVSVHKLLNYTHLADTKVYRRRLSLQKVLSPYPASLRRAATFVFAKEKTGASSENRRWTAPGQALRKGRLSRDHWRYRALIPGTSGARKRYPGSCRRKWS
jgi:hypothetical protein